MTKQQLEEKVRELEVRISLLEMRPMYYLPVQVSGKEAQCAPIPEIPHHYHNGMPCYKNPCVTC